MFQGVPTSKRITLLTFICLVLGGFITLVLWTNRADYQVLFSNLDAVDAGRITETLREKRISYQLKEGGTAILVPEQNVYELRLELASEGLPQGHNVGFEVFDDMPFGTTEFVQRLRYQQALQGELARTIMDFDAVSQARVHIVTASESLFVEPENRSTASVVLRLHQGRGLNPRQLQGIINLVARAVEGLNPENVTVVDMQGGLLSKGNVEGSLGSLTASQFDYRKKMEESLERRVQTMLEPVVGHNKVVARVSVAADFSQVNISEEEYDPDSAVVRSEQRQKETAIGGEGLPSGSPDLKYEIYQSQAGATASGKSFAKENSVVNYEINRVKKETTNSVGNVKRLSAAVIIDGPYVSERNAEGNTIQKFVPRSRREIKGFENIVKKAIGFDEERGDQVTVSNIPFAIQEEQQTTPVANPGWIEQIKKRSKLLLNVLLVLLFFFFGLRPFRKFLRQTGSVPAPQALPAGQEIPRLESGLGENPPDLIHRDQIIDIKNTEPEKIAQIVRGWLAEGR
jgi:flagellar M-ring protein FliF